MRCRALGGLVLVFLLGGAPGLGAAGDHLDGIVAIVNDSPITFHELHTAIAPYRARLRASGAPVGRQSEEEIASDVLEGMIDDRLLLDEGKRMGLEVSRSQIEQHMSRLKQSNGWGDPELESAVMASGFDSLAAFRTHLEDEYLRNQLLGIKVLSRIKIDPKEVERAYEKELEDGLIEERQVAHILKKLDTYASDEAVTRARGLLEGLRERILAGEVSFSAMAQEHSDDPTAPAGGDLGFFGKGSLDPSFEAAAFGLDNGAISEPVRTPFGLHLIQLLNTRRRALVDASQKEDLMSQIRFRIRAKEQERLYGQWIQSLRDQAFIEIRR